ncbi:MAG: class I SAM-dependent methyltransferase [Acidimicrobiales bacterium]
MIDRERLGFDPGSVFDDVAADYERWRPDYPEVLYDALEGAVGRLDAQRVLDIGAGTGISGRALSGRGARVVALDPSLAMARTQRSSTPPLPATLAHAEALPVRDRCVDLVTCAQAWHWVRLPEAARECRRVLAPGGAGALWWNGSEDRGAFFDELASECGIDRYGGRDRQDDDESLVGLGGFGEVRRVALRWEWTVPIEHWMETVRTRSVLAKLGPGADERLDAIGAVARAHFPGGAVSEWFTTRLAIAAP